MKDLARFLAVLAIFVFGFSMHFVALNQPFHNFTPDELRQLPRTVATSSIFSDVVMNPLVAFELLFFAVFGQTTYEEMMIQPQNNNARRYRPAWTENLFKIVFGIYMLVSVVVLINLLIAMMSDTYQRIQAQSDIEWKFGLSKLIRNMHRTTTAPSPINLVTTWLFYLVRICKAKVRSRKRPSLIQLMGVQRQMSARTKAGMKWLSKVKKGSQVAPKESTGLSVVHLSPLGSQLSFANTTRIEHVADWEQIAKKYRALNGEEEIRESGSGEDDETQEDEGSSGNT